MSADQSVFARFERNPIYVVVTALAVVVSLIGFGMAMAGIGFFADDDDQATTAGQVDGIANSEGAPGSGADDDLFTGIERSGEDGEDDATDPNGEGAGDAVAESAGSAGGNGGSTPARSDAEVVADRAAVLESYPDCQVLGLEPVEGPTGMAVSAGSRSGCPFAEAELTSPFQVHDVVYELLAGTELAFEFQVFNTRLPIVVLDPSGATVLSFEGSSGIDRFTAIEAGRYTVRIENSDRSATEYWVKLTDVTVPVVEATQLSVGAFRCELGGLLPVEGPPSVTATDGDDGCPVVSAALNAPYEVQHLGFDIEADRLVAFEFQVFNTRLPIVVLDPSGATVLSFEGSSGIDRFTAIEAGRYTVRIENSDRSATEYWVKLTDVTVPVVEATQLSVGAFRCELGGLLPVEGPPSVTATDGDDGCPVVSAALSAPFEAQELVFDVAAGSDVAFEFQVFNTRLPIVVLDPSGATVLSFEGSSGIDRFTAIEAGRYTVRIENSARTGTEYWIKLTLTN